VKKVCLVYANCQNKLIAEYLNQSTFFNQEYQIHRYAVHMLMEQQKTIPDEMLKQAELFVYQPVKNIHGDRSSQSILDRLPSSCRTISFPSLYFKGYFPQYCKNPVNHVIKPNYPYGVIPHGDANIISLLTEGKTIAEIISILSDPDFYTQEFSLETLNKTIAELRHRESSLDVKLSDFIKSHYQDYYLFHTQNHPTDIVGIYIANQILKLLNLPKISDPLLFTNPQRGVLDNFQVPIYPSVIKHLGLKFAQEKIVYRHSSFATNELSFAQYISEYAELHLSSENSANQYHFQAINSAKDNKLSPAVAKLKQAIKIKPNQAVYYGELGNILYRQKKFNDAESAYRQAIVLSPTWEDFYQALGDVLVKQNNFSEAISVYQQAIALNPLNATLYRSLGDAWMKQGQLESAEVAYQKALNIDPMNPFYYRRLGDVFQQTNSLDLAVANYRKAIALEPKTAYFYTNLGRTLAQQNKLDEAINNCKKAIALANKNPDYHRTLGDIQLQKGEIDQALNTYQKAISLNSQQINQIFFKLSTVIKANISRVMLLH
jgi:tetratricopeptide (TPR) repeat protein